MFNSQENKRASPVSCKSCADLNSLDSVTVKSVFITLSAALLLTPALAQDSATRALLGTFCDGGNIKGDTCTHAKGYPASGKKSCDVKLLKDRFSGRFGAGNPLLVVNYESGCESRANDDGGAVVFEQVAGKTSFVGFAPGARVNECVVVPRGEKQDSLVCIAGHMGQGYLESGIAQMLFERDYGKGITVKYDFLLRAVDSSGATGANVVTCRKKPPAWFELTKLVPGPRAGTVAFDATWADAETLKTVCSKAFSKPKETFGTLPKGEAYVPEELAKKGRVVIDLVTRKVLP